MSSSSSICHTWSIYAGVNVGTCPAKSLLEQTVKQFTTYSAPDPWRGCRIALMVGTYMFRQSSACCMMQKPGCMTWPITPNLDPPTMRFVSRNRTWCISSVLVGLVGNFWEVPLPYHCWRAWRSLLSENHDHIWVAQSRLYLQCTFTEDWEFLPRSFGYFLCLMRITLPQSSCVMTRCSSCLPDYVQPDQPEDFARDI